MTRALSGLVQVTVLVMIVCTVPCRAVTILATGNSITEGYIGGTLDPDNAYTALLEELVCQEQSACSVINAGRGGETIADGALRFFRDLQEADPDITIVFFGRNDMLVQTGGSLRVPPENFREALRFMVRESKARGAAPILVTPPPVLPDRYYEYHDRELYEAFGGVEHLVGEYEEEVRLVAREEEAVLADIVPLFADSLGSLLGPDGSHPSGAGHLVIARELARVVDKIDQGSEPGEPVTGARGIEDCYAYPNPYHPAGGALLSVHVGVVEAGEIDVKIYDVSGRLVRAVRGVTISDPGEHWFVWDGCNDGGGALAPGVYLIRLGWVSLEGEDREGTTLKVALLR